MELDLQPITPNTHGLDSPEIYHTPFFANKIPAARANLQRALARLQHN